MRIMVFSRESLAVGGMISVPDSFMNKGPGEIVGCTPAGINVMYNKGTGRQALAFYAYDWLNQMYGAYEPPAHDDMNDSVPF